MRLVESGSSASVASWSAAASRRRIAAIDPLQSVALARSRHSRRSVWRPSADSRCKRNLTTKAGGAGEVLLRSIQLTTTQRHRLGDAKGNQQRRGCPWYYGEAKAVEVRLKRGTREKPIEDTSPGAGHHVRAIERRWNRVVHQSIRTRTDGRTVGSPGTLASVLRFSFVPMPS